MKNRTRLITLARLGLTVGLLAMLGALPAARALGALPAEAKGDDPADAGRPTDCTEAANGSCSGGFTLASTDPTNVFCSSVAWGDYDDDGDLDILLAGWTGSLVRVAEVWRNDGGGTFTQISTALTGVYQASVAWGDYDDDGDLDILLAGRTGGSTGVTEVWRNDSGGTFIRASTAPTGVYLGSVAWGDYDDDGDLDILLAGTTGSTRVTEVWRNDGGGTFTQISTALTGVVGNAVWGDYDDDGDLDILLAGYTGSVRVAEVWRNDGGGTFAQASSDPTGVSSASVAWGDYDDDGDLDILLAGDTGSDRVTEVWRNDGGDIFALASTTLTGVSQGDVAWGDYDDDGDLDILLAGQTSSLAHIAEVWPHITEVWRNEGGGAFTLTSTALTDVYQASVAWGDYDDDGDLDILLAGTAGSITRVTEVWRNETCRCVGGTFTQASDDPTGVFYASAAWGDYDDDGDLDILLAGRTANTQVTEVWENDGNGAFAWASSDPTGVEYSSVAWGDYDDDGDLDILLAGYSGSARVTEVWRNNGGGSFARASSDPTGVYRASVAWGDYDDDGDLDILLAGRTASTQVTEVWRNDGSDTFTQTITALTGVYNSSVAWGDYDDDGDLDILLAGDTGSGSVTEVWRNEGSDTFTQTVALTGVSDGGVTWGDYDDDGDLDILLAGYASGPRVVEVWRNEGSDTFILASSDPTGVYQASVAWGDYDDDGDLDILLAGDTGTTRVTEVWRNDGGATFSLASSDPTGVSYSSVAWGDYDDDGDLDILLAGDTGSGYVTEVWRSECLRVFLPLVLRND